MIEQLQPRTTSAHPRPARTRHTCVACGAPFGARAGEQHLNAIFCPVCTDEGDDPVTAEHYWDLGGGD